MFLSVLLVYAWCWQSEETLRPRSSPVGAGIQAGIFCNILEEQHLGLLSNPKITISLSHWTNVPQWEQEAGNSSEERMLAGDWSFQKASMTVTMWFPQTTSEHTS